MDPSSFMGNFLKFKKKKKTFFKGAAERAK